MKYLLFDLDGTLTDPGEGITRSAQYALERLGIEVKDAKELRPFVGPPLQESFQKLYGLDDAAVKAAVAGYREYYSDRGIYENAIYDGIKGLLEKLREAGKVILLATSKPTVFAEIVLKTFHIHEYFSFIGGSELDGSRSRKGEVIGYVLDQMGITELGEAVMIGDREHDVIGAKEAGISSIGVLYGYGELEELQNSGADKIVSTVAELARELL